MTKDFVLAQLSHDEVEAVGGGALPVIILGFALFAGGGYKVGTDRAKRDNCVHNGRC